MKMTMTFAILQALLLAFSLVNLSTQQQQTFNDLQGKVNGGSGLSCYVCNTKVGGCDPRANFQKLCKTEYLQEVYGDPPAGSSDLREYPTSLSSMAATGMPNDRVGWNLAGYPALYRAPARPPASSWTASSLHDLLLDGKLDDGFQSCRLMKISAIAQQNGGVKKEIPYTTSRMIRTCSFLKKGDIQGLNSKGCKQIKFKTAFIEVCYCDSDNCNRSSYMRVSYWMMAASFLVILAQFAMHKV